MKEAEKPLLYLSAINHCEIKTNPTLQKSLSSAITKEKSRGQNAKQLTI